MSDGVKATVIIPVYNTPRPQLARCFASLRHCGEDIRILAIDDGSEQETAAALDAYRASGVTVLHKRNGGVSDARNYGLARAEGKYVFFVDADDAVRDGFPYPMIDAMERDRLEILICDIVIRPDGRTEHTGYPKNTVASGASLAGENPALYANFDLCYSVRMGFQRSFLEKNNLRFRTDMTVSEDMAFNMRALACAKRVMAVDAAYYEYWLDYQTSATRSRYIPHYSDNMALAYKGAKASFAFSESLQRQLAAFYMDFVFYNIVRNEKNGGGLSYAAYRDICEMPMFRESMRVLGPAHACENAKAQLLYRMRYYGAYRLPYKAAVG